MGLHANPQTTGQTPPTRPKTMTTWTSPQSEVQKRYYSKRKGKLRAYEVTAVLIQVVWAYYDFPAYNYIFQSAFEGIPSMLWTAPWVSALLLVVMHYILRETYITYWFDKLDDDEKTDSSIWIPLVLVAVLFVAGRYGVKMSIEAKIAVPVEKTYVEAEQSRNDRDARLTSQYDSEKAAIEETYKKKAAAATISIDSRIAALQRRRPDDDKERRRINGEISTLRQRRADAIAPIEQAKAAELTTLLEQRKEQQRTIDHDYNKAIGKVNLHNETKSAEHADTMSQIGWGSWVLSFFFIFIYCALGYAIVSIKVKSGILPQRDHTVLDQYGGTFGRALYVLQDIFNRQFYRLTLLIHRLGTYGTATLSQMDASYNEVEALYNTAPTLPAGSPQKSEVDALKEVMAKMVHTRTQLTPEQVADEVALSRSSNGSYPDMPWLHESDDLGKSEAPAAQGPQQTAGAERYAAADPDYSWLLARWKSMVENQLQAYDQAVIDGRPGHAKAIQQYIFTDPSSPVVKEGKRLHLNWGVKDAAFVVGHRDRTHFVPLEHLTESALLADNSTDIDVPAEGEDESLFKYDLNRFKAEVLPEHDPAGKVIGVKFLKADGEWGNIGLAQVRAYHTIYEKYNRKENPGKRVQEGLAKWKYALSLFDEGRAVRQEALETVHE